MTSRNRLLVFLIYFLRTLSTVFVSTISFAFQMCGTVQVRGVSELNCYPGIGHRQCTRCIVPIVAEHNDFVRLPYRVQSVRLSSVAFHPKTKVNA
jgi:hypothetical protein